MEFSPPVFAAQFGVPDWQLRVREIDETLRLMDDELETNSGSEFFAWMAATLNKLKNVARS